MGQSFYICATMTFEDYLTQKKIDAEAFRKAEPDTWNSLKYIFDQMHPKSFTSQKLFLINPIRRSYPLTAEAVTEEKSVKKAAKPVIKSSVKPKPTMSRPKLK